MVKMINTITVVGEEFEGFNDKAVVEIFADTVFSVFHLSALNLTRDESIVTYTRVGKKITGTLIVGKFYVELAGEVLDKNKYNLEVSVGEERRLYLSIGS